MAKKDLLRTEVGERVDQTDFQHATDTSQRRIMQSIGDDFLVGHSNDIAHPSHLVLHGFACSASGVEITITRGAAIVGMRSGGTVEYGMILADGAASKTIDMGAGGYSDLTEYKVFIRFEFRDDEFRNRMFWDRISVPQKEVVRNIATRKSEDWSVSIELVSPGPEWMEIATVQKNGVMMDTGYPMDTRTFFFDTKTSAITNTDWGTSNDRAVTNRDTGNGVFGLYKHVKAVLRQLQDIVGGAGWVIDPKSGSTNGTGPRSLTQLNSEKLGRNGSQTMQGDFVPDVDNTYDLGDPAARWRQIHGGDLFDHDGYIDMTGTSNTSTIPYIYMKRKSGSPRTLIFAEENSAGGGVKIRQYLTNAVGDQQTGGDFGTGMEYVINAEWNYGTARWNIIDITSAAIIFVYSKDRYIVGYRTDTAPWEDAYGDVATTFSSGETWDMQFWVGATDGFRYDQVNDRFVVEDLQITDDLLVTDQASANQFIATTTYSFLAAQNYSHSVGMGGAVIHNAVTDVVFESSGSGISASGNIGLLTATAVGATRYIPILLNLPEGVEVYDWETVVETSSAGDIELSVWRIDRSTRTRTALTASTSVPSSGGSLDKVDLASLTASSAIRTINNANYDYFLEIKFNNGVTAKVQSVTLLYNMTAIKPA